MTDNSYDSNEMDLKDDNQINEEDNEEFSEKDIDEDDIINIDEVEGLQAYATVSNGNHNEALITMNPSHKEVNNLNENNLNDMKLQSLDLNTVSKEDAVNYLLYNTEFKKKNISLSPQTKRKRNKNRYTKVKSMYNKEILKPNYFLNLDDPECTHDFNTALTRIVASKINDRNEDKRIKQALISKKKMKKVEKLESCKTDYIHNKVSNYLEQKNRKIESMQDNLNEKFLNNHTFCPKTNIDKNKLGDLNQFLEYQNKHLQRVNEKVNRLKEEKEQKFIYDPNPKIDEKSQKIFNNKIKSDDPAYVRLYNQKKNYGEKKTDEKKLKSKNINKEEVINTINNLYAKAMGKKDRIKELEEKINNEVGKSEVNSLVSSNKIILTKFISQYKDEINQIEKNMSIEQKTIENNTNQSLAPNNSTNFDTQSNIQISQSISNEIKESNKSKPKLTLLHLNNILLKLNFISPEKEFSNNTIVNFNESSLKLVEKKLVNDIYENLKNQEGFIELEQLLLFLLCLINLYEYYLVKINKHLYNIPQILSEINEKKKNDLFKFKSKSHDKLGLIKNGHLSHAEQKKEVNKFILDKINQEILSKIKHSKKYGGLDENNVYYISIQMAKNINKDFNLLSINWSNYNHMNNKENQKKVSYSNNTNLTFKPNINSRSKKLSVNFRRKIQNEVDTHIGQPVTNHSPLINSNKFDLNYIQLLLIKKKKQEKLMAKKKEEMETKEYNQCTFKPKIIQTPELEPFSRAERFEQLYKIGTTSNLNKKDKKKEDFEVIDEKVLTFKPNIEKPAIPAKKIDVSFGEKEYVNKFNRLKCGRIERKLKDLICTREPFSSKIDLEAMENTIYIRNQPALPVMQPKFETENNSIKATLTNIIDKDAEDSISAGEKNSIPLLIIDVNLRPGEKKKIYVFDGDTAEGLAENFSKENSLDNETKNKLKILIQSHMSKLLMRIEEENQSINSERSLNF